MRPLLIALLLAGWSTVIYQVGHTHGAAEVEVKRGLERSQASDELLAANGRVTSAQQQLTDSLSARDATHQKELKNAQVDHDLRVAALRAGTLRVSIPVKAAACAAPAAAGATPAGEPAEARAELTPEAAATLEGIVLDGDTAIIDLNLCIDRYNAVRGTVLQLSQAQP
ncbi:lysis system i-spanin subunit Rz [Polaromonas naphthalenivorans]|uniref:Phage protein, putative n=1 Tax=Polaromonas naphthalenivorans (strain CJ2) TaxID=365044 RepID=A1VSG7_POLNA|nr:lysis system i-spanin subunit Rz [Polaromonas naphthalenivorans]ABM38595.1 phage protein, putative [Polaromonas naphthalenivorans CJ2]